MDKALLNYVNFFNLDLMVKKQIYELNGASYLNYDEVIRYADKLYDSINSIQNKFLNMCKLFNMSENVCTAVYELMSNIKERIVNTDYSMQDLKSIYNNYFASMSEDVLKEIRKNIYGDSTVYDEIEDWILVELIKSCKSVNELLHFFHSYMVNNLDALRAIPEIAYKENDDCSVTLRGTSNDLAWQIYEAFDISVDVGTTDIVSITDDKMLITVRDRGHALQIETEGKNDREIGVYYFIPKVVVPEMFHNIKGINTVKKGNTFAFGSFVTNKELASSEIFDVVKKVPTDLDYMDFIHRSR